MSRPNAVRLLGTAIVAVLATNLAVVARGAGTGARPVAHLAAAEPFDLASVVVAPSGLRPVAAGRLTRRSTDGGLGAVAAALAKLDLAGGYVASWRSLDRRTSATTFLLDFPTESGASAYAGNLASAGTLFARPRTFGVPGLPDARGLADTRADVSGRRPQVVVLRAGHLVALVVWRDVGLLPAPGLVELALRQQETLDLATRH